MIGNILALTNSTSNENIEVDGLLKKGLYNGTASDLKEDIDKKVSQEAGKGLSSNDYTNEEKQKNEENANKRIVGFTVTGDVNKIITLTFADSTVMQAPFNDNDHIPLADVNMNSLNFNENTGVLTGVKSDGNEISVSLDGRYSLIGHNHDEQYSPKTHTHSEYAPSSHRHNLGDIDGIPNNLATTENIKTAIEGIQIGGRNLLRNSGRKITNNSYLITAYDITTELKEGETVTVTLKGQLGAGKQSFGLYNSGGEVSLSELENKGNGIYQKTFNWIVKLGVHTASNKKLFIFTIFSNVSIDSTIEWVKLERGNKATDWSPAPEDIENKIDTIIKAGDITGSNDWSYNLDYLGGTIVIETTCVVRLDKVPSGYSGSILKSRDNNNITFSCDGKQIVYTGDNTINGKDGSTATFTIYKNKCYIRISNV